MQSLRKINLTLIVLSLIIQIQSLQNLFINPNNFINFKCFCFNYDNSFDNIGMPIFAHLEISLKIYLDRYTKLNFLANKILQI